MRGTLAARQMLLLWLVTLCLAVSAEENTFSPWEKLPGTEGTIADVNYRRSMVDDRGRVIREQYGLGSNPAHIVVKRDAAYRYEENESGRVAWVEEKQFDEKGSLTLLIREKHVNDQKEEEIWFNAQGKRISQKEFLPSGFISHMVLLLDQPLKSEGLLLVIERMYTEEDNHEKDGITTGEVYNYYYDRAGRLLYVKQQVRDVEKNAVHEEPCDRLPSKAVEELVTEWFSH